MEYPKIKKLVDIKVVKDEKNFFISTPSYGVMIPNYNFTNFIVFKKGDDVILKLNSDLRILHTFSNVRQDIHEFYRRVREASLKRKRNDDDDDNRSPKRRDIWGNSLIKEKVAPKPKENTDKITTVKIPEKEKRKICFK